MVRFSTSILPPISRQFRIYIMVGVAAFVSEYAVFALLLLFTPNLLVAQTSSFLVGLAVSFTGSRHITFKQSDGKQYALGGRAQLWRYVLLAFTNLVVTNILIDILVGHLAPLVAKIAVMAMVMLWNYLIFRRLIFRAAD